MQVVADVLNMPIKVARSEQACALGSAMMAAVASGIYTTVSEAQKQMGGGIETEYFPITENAEKYQELFNKYLDLGKFAEFVFWFFLDWFPSASIPENREFLQKGFFLLRIIVLRQIFF